MTSPVTTEGVTLENRHEFGSDLDER